MHKFRLLYINFHWRISPDKNRTETVLSCTSTTKLPWLFLFFAEGTPISFQHELQMKPLMLTYYNANQKLQAFTIFGILSVAATDWLVTGITTTNNIFPHSKKVLKVNIEYVRDSRRNLFDLFMGMLQGIMVSKTCIKWFPNRNQQGNLCSREKFWCLRIC